MLTHPIVSRSAGCSLKARVPPRQALRGCDATPPSPVSPFRADALDHSANNGPAAGFYLVPVLSFSPDSSLVLPAFVLKKLGVSNRSVPHLCLLPANTNQSVMSLILAKPY